MLHIRMVNCQMKDLDNVYIISQTLAHYFPSPEQFVTGIHELLLNALEHGTLGIGFEEKSRLLRQRKWHEEMIRRLASPEYADKAVDITLAHDEQECRLTIADPGNGFDWKNHIDYLIDDRHPNGRGLQIAFNSQFDHIAFNQAGNEVTCVVRYSLWTALTNETAAINCRIG